MKFVTGFVASILVFSTALSTGTTGKIAGTVIDAKTREKLIGVNVVVEGTTMGASTNVEGYYFIINVPAGLYKLKVSYLGYTTINIADVRVAIDQTTNVDAELEETSISTQEIVIVAQRPVVQKDVAASVANIASLETLPFTTVSSVVGLQAGIQAGLVVRGGGADQTAFIVDGLTLRNERDNTPYSGISLSSVQDIQVQTGGFNAEYGNIRSGVVNVTTKEGGRGYSLSATVRVSPPEQKHFGPSVYNPDSYWLKGKLDPAVAWTGTANGSWDLYTQRQFLAFEGWNAVSAATLKDNDPSNDLSPLAAQKLFLFQFRRQGDIVKPDFDIDAGVGGPVPGGEGLGDLRFFASYRQSKSMYLIPLSRDAYEDNNGQLRVTSDVGSGMKLTVEGIVGQQTGTNNNNSGLPGLFQSASGIASVLDRVSYIDVRIYSPDYFAPSTIKMNSVGAKFTDVLSPSTFFEASLHRQQFSYDTNPGRARDPNKQYLFGDAYYVDEAPFGFAENSGSERIFLTNGIGFSNSRDTSKLTTYSAKFDLSSQVDKYNELKVGTELVYTHSEVNYALKDYIAQLVTRSNWDTQPIRFSLYAQNKLEYSGMIVNAGLRLDYSNPGGTWYIVKPFDPNLDLAQSGTTSLDNTLTKEPVKKIVNLSPRLGVAFPVTEYAKLFFNYGHFRSMPTPENLFLVRVDPRFNTISRLANPNNPLPKTVAYELGYEHSLMEEFLIRISGYYKNVTDQSNLITYLDKSGTSYSISVPNSYEDIRGYELTFSRNSGSWLTGFVNYTYMVNSTGRYGFSQVKEDRTAQLDYQNLQANRVADLYQTKPLARPYARASLDFSVPSGSGPDIAGVDILDDLRLNVTANWQSGSYFTWFGGGSAPADLQYNAQYRDTYGLDLRLSKGFHFGPANLVVFMDMSNALNIRNFSGYGFVNADDFNYYMKSLHLKSSMYDPRSGYLNISGSDQPGDVRKEGVAFTPVEAVGSLPTSNIQAKAIYWDQSSSKYMLYNGTSWDEVPASRMSQILKDKSYIDMPNMDYFVFLNPRDIFWGMRLSVNL